MLSDPAEYEVHDHDSFQVVDELAEVQALITATLGPDHADGVVLAGRPIDALRHLAAETGAPLNPGGGRLRVYTDGMRRSNTLRKAISQAGLMVNGRTPIVINRTALRTRAREHRRYAEDATARYAIAATIRAHDKFGRTRECTANITPDIAAIAVALGTVSDGFQVSERAANFEHAKRARDNAYNYAIVLLAHTNHEDLLLHLADLAEADRAAVAELIADNGIDTLELAGIDDPVAEAARNTARSILDHVDRLIGVESSIPASPPPTKRGHAEVISIDALRAQRESRTMAPYGDLGR